MNKSQQEITPTQTQTKSHRNGKVIQSAHSSHSSQSYKKQPENNLRMAGEAIMDNKYSGHLNRSEMAGNRRYEPLMHQSHEVQSKPPLPNYPQFHSMHFAPRDIASNPNPYVYNSDGPLHLSMERNNHFWPNDRTYSAQQDNVYPRTQTLSPGKNNKFKPYSIKDYQDLKTRIPSKLGGLGSNVNSDDWKNKKNQVEKATEFSQNVKLFNSQTPPIIYEKKPQSYPFKQQIS